MLNLQILAWLAYGSGAVSVHLRMAMLDFSLHYPTRSGLTPHLFQDYFSSTVGAVKKVLLNYNKTGRSVGVATITFHKATSAAEAAKQYDGVKVDGKPMKVSMISNTIPSIF